MQIIDAFQQTLDAVTKKTGDVEDIEDEAERLLETINGHKAALTKILLESPVNVLQDVEQDPRNQLLLQQMQVLQQNLEVLENFQNAFQQMDWANLHAMI